jgi:hypothetical protein
VHGASGQAPDFGKLLNERFQRRAELVLWRTLDGNVG